MQRSNTRELIFKIPETVAFLSSVMTLEPGDVVLTGTPAGVGFSRKPTAMADTRRRGRGPRGRSWRTPQHLRRRALSMRGVKNEEKTENTDKTNAS